MARIAELSQSTFEVGGKMTAGVTVVGEPRRPCLKADFPGDTCKFWVEHYGQTPCENCA